MPLACLSFAQQIPGPDSNGATSSGSALIRVEEAQGAVHGTSNEDGFGEGHQAVHVAGFVGWIDGHPHVLRAEKRHVC